MQGLVLVYWTPKTSLLSPRTVPHQFSFHKTDLSGSHEAFLGKLVQNEIISLSHHVHISIDFCVTHIVLSITNATNKRDMVVASLVGTKVINKYSNKPIVTDNDKDCKGKGQ